MARVRAMRLDARARDQGRRGNMSTLDGEELGRLRAIDVAIARHEPVSHADASWLVERLYDMSHDFGELEKEAKAQENDEGDRADAAEALLEEEREKTTVLTTQCASLASEVDDMRARLDGAWHPERLKFLRKALSACIEAVVLAESDDGDDSMLTKGDNGSTLPSLARSGRKPKPKVRKRS